MKDQAVLKLLQSRIGSADWSRWQMQRWCFYDYARYPVAGTSQLTFFANPLGSVDANSGLAKTLEQTNLPKARTFGQVYFVIQQIRTHLHLLPFQRQNATIGGFTGALFGGLTGNYDNLMQALMDISGQGVLNIKIGQKDYYDINQPLRFCPPGFGVNIIHHASANTGSIWHQQSPDLRDVYSQTPPQMIEPEQTFETTFDYPNGVSPSLAAIVNGQNPAVDIGVILDGYIARPVQ